MRPSPGEAPKLPDVDDGLMRETRTYQFLTPVFGGGVKLSEDDKVGTKDIDPITPIRVPSIRGQLRFWWRAANPRGCRTVKELYQAETEVFGGLKWKDPKDGKQKTRRSAWLIHVVKQPAAPSRLEVFKQGMAAITYAAFPLRGSARDNPVHGTLHDFGSKTFELQFVYPTTVQADVRAALWAWSTFGGLGGRTRRGFGAIADMSKQVTIEDLDSGWRAHVTGVEVEWPHLPPFDQRRLACPPASDGMSALKTLLKKFKDLRQGVGLGRNQGQERLEGRSFWPEPDAIRKLTGRAAKNHEKRMTEVDAFPRAAFGMPIIFHFKDQNQADPKDTTLQPAEEDVDRFASPLLLRPYRDPTTKQVMALAVELASKIPAAELKGGRGGEVLTKVTPAQAAAMKRPPNANGLFPKMFHDPIGAYLDLLKGKS